MHLEHNLYANIIVTSQQNYVYINNVPYNVAYDFTEYLIWKQQLNLFICILKKYVNVNVEQKVRNSNYLRFNSYNARQMLNIRIFIAFTVHINICIKYQIRNIILGIFHKCKYFNQSMCDFMCWA